jgi:D-alanyl-lipoteichoic acid acyltransferase DltB (MBOAT superfamily)
LVAGPIERATHLLPQLRKVQHFDAELATDGLRQILWGLVKKMVLADLFASYADQVFDHYQYYTGSTLFLGGVFFAVQIYGDFSGYSDIAIGSGKLIGIRLLRNFNFPYFSHNMAEFWRRWHISLSSFFRDYVYIPLGGSKTGKAHTTRNVLIVFLLTGIWHGAGVNFILWGLFNAVCVLPYLLWPSKQHSSGLRAFGGWLLTSILVVLGWILFRSTSLMQAKTIFLRIFSNSLFTQPALVSRAIPVLAIAGVFFTMEWLGRRNEYALQSIGLRWPPVIRWGLYYFLFLVVAYYMGRTNTFIYFQF